MSRPAPTDRRPDASMTLLTTMVQRPLDPGYAAAADRREAKGEPRSTSLRSPLLAIAAVLIGLVVGVASYNLTALENAEIGDTSLTDRTRALSAAVGSVPLHGPGFTLTLDDAPGSGADEAAPGDTKAQQGQVQAKDLRYVTNALWESGAEAVSINGQRLTATAAIRFAGSARPGQHNDDIYGGLLGLSTEEIDELHTRGVL